MTDYFKVSAEELRAKEISDLRTAAQEVRKTLAHMRLDVYTAPGVNAGKGKRLKKALARILTVQNEKSRVNG